VIYRHAIEFEFLLNMNSEALNGDIKSDLVLIAGVEGSGSAGLGVKSFFRKQLRPALSHSE
jgi:hypothetical protein